MSGITYIGVMILVLIAFNIVILRPRDKDRGETDIDQLSGESESFKKMFRGGV